MAGLNAKIYSLDIQEPIDGAYMVVLPTLNNPPTFDQISQSLTSLGHISRAYRKELKVTSTTVSTCLVDTKN